MTPAVLEELYLVVRGLLYLGGRHRCPCCGWRVRAFTAGGGSLLPRERGYCPRCNAKARHRRVWLHLLTSGLLDDPVRVLHAAPHRSLARALRRTPTVTYESVDLLPLPHVTTIADLTALPHGSGSFDGIVSVHVLEHLDDDRAAIAEMARVLRPGGWAVVNVPCRWDAATYEDAAITTPAARRAAFGEDDHRRVYGRDIVDRLGEAGFEVTVTFPDDLGSDVAERHGLTHDELIFFCRVPSPEVEG